MNIFEIFLTVVSFTLVFVIILMVYIQKEAIRQLKTGHSAVIQTIRNDAVKKSKDILRGHISQEFIPLFPDFPYNMSDCKFSGQPLDFIVFKGMSDLRDNIPTDIEIIFADVKTGNAQRTKIQNAIKKAIENKNIKFETWIVLENKQLKIK